MLWKYVVTIVTPINTWIELNWEREREREREREKEGGAELNSKKKKETYTQSDREREREGGPIPYKAWAQKEKTGVFAGYYHRMCSRASETEESSMSVNSSGAAHYWGDTPETHLHFTAITTLSRFSCFSDWLQKIILLLNTFVLFPSIHIWTFLKQDAFIAQVK